MKKSTICKTILKVLGIAVVCIFAVIGAVDSVLYIWKFVSPKTQQGSSTEHMQASINAESGIVTTLPSISSGAVWLATTPRSCGCGKPASRYFNGNIPHALVANKPGDVSSPYIPCCRYFAHQLVTGMTPDKDRWLLLQCIDANQAINNAMYLITTELLPRLGEKGLDAYWLEDMEQRMGEHWYRECWCPQLDIDPVDNYVKLYEEELRRTGKLVGEPDVEP